MAMEWRAVHDSHAVLFTALAVNTMHVPTAKLEECPKH